MVAVHAFDNAFGHQSSVSHLELLKACLLAGRAGMLTLKNCARKAVAHRLKGLLDVLES